MRSHTRALVAASTFAAITGKKVAGLYDHSAARNLQIAAECRGARLQAHDGDRAVKFGGTLPELYDEGDEAYVSLTIEGETARGHDRQTASDCSVRLSDGVVQVYDHALGEWFAYDIQGPDTGVGYHRDAS